MNVLDENFPEDQKLLLRQRRVRVRQIGRDLARRGLPDDAILPLLHQLRRATLFTLDLGFYDRRRCHSSYGIAVVAVREDDAASFIRPFLRHPVFDTQAKRMGVVACIGYAGVRFYRLHGDEQHADWPSSRQRPQV